ncbi:MAG TPA: M20/M25/M40 family metallo-hydrolase [Holophagaceae bacterium]|jgi:carboxypeptidase Q|nr:M20/M25/M40 family metallo-hydrolase [Holophagaceae bacterium]
MPRILPALVASASLFGQAPAPIQSQVPATPTMPGLFQADALPKTDATRILQEIANHSQAFSNLEEMCDTIGPRLTGSDNLRRAQAWAMDKLKAYGAENVHEEAYDLGPSWTRGQDSARLLTQNHQTLQIAAMGWTPSTRGVIRGEVLVVQADTLDQLMSFKGKLAGHIVMMGTLPKIDWRDPQQRAGFHRAMDQFKQEKPLAMLSATEKQDDHMTMNGSPLEGEGLTHVPSAFIANEHADLLKRLAKRGGKIEMELQIGGETSKAPVKAYNVVAEIRGSEKPDEVVIVGGHQDSWDLGTGATDNGTGTVAAMEVIRAIKALGLQPKRTIRCILFSGEEQGLMGSEAYVKAHADELKNIQAVLIDDLGTGAIKGWTLQGREDLAPAMGAAMAGANVIGCKELFFGSVPAASDNWPFEIRGVPSFFAFQDFADYFTNTHHSQLDTLDHVKPDELLQGAQAMAVTAWGLANMPDRLVQAAPKKDPVDHD